MKKDLNRFLSIVLAFAMTLTLLSGITPPAKAAGDPTGSGTVADPYLIGTYEELLWFGTKAVGNYVNICGKLTADIVVNTGDVAGCNGVKAEGWVEWDPVGGIYYGKYTGTFDGNNHTISGLYVNKPDTSYSGLFGCVDAGGVIKNVGIINSYIFGKNAVGAVVGNLESATITNCYSASTVVGNTIYVGGVCGKVTKSTVTACHNSGKVSGDGAPDQGIGGVAGDLSGGTITDSYNTGEVSSNTGYAGGVVGTLQDNEIAGLLTKCYNSGKVTGACYVGGVCGYLTTATISDSYNTGAVSAISSSGSVTVNNSETGGICGNSTGNIQGCYNTGKITGYNYISGICGITTTLVENSNNQGAVSGANFIGGICGSSGGPIKSCFNSGLIEGSSGKVGGISGAAYGRVEGCYNTAQAVVKASSGIGGGIAGFSEGTIASCYNEGTVTSTGANMGGICGYCSKGSVTSSYNTGSVQGSCFVGGIVGYIKTTVTIVGSYNSGVVHGSDTSVGSICGTTETMTQLTNCYYLIGTATDKNNILQTGVATKPGIEPPVDQAENVVGKTEVDFSSGALCYLMNDSVTDSSQLWYQNIDIGTADSTPKFSGGTVYQATCVDCGGGAYDPPRYGYTNDPEKTVIISDHPGTYDENGFCTICGKSYQPATLNNNGTADDETDDYYEIANAGQLCWFAAQVNAGNTGISGKLTADINLNGVTWSGIGNASNTFSGTFDGGGFAISNMNSAKTNVSPGLIYALGTNGAVKDLTMKFAFTFDQNGQNKGIVVGANSGSIEAVLVTDSQIKMGNYDGMGGIAGKNTGTISNCGAVNVTITRVWGAVAGNKTAGAITENNAGAVLNCYSYGITFAGGTEANAGALVATGTAPLNSCYLSTDISTDNKVAAGAGGTAATAAQFASGEVCWLLNGSASTGVWKQDLDVDDTPDASPNFTGAAVYYGYTTYDENGFGSTIGCSNTALAENLYQPATLNNNGTADDATDDYYEIANAGQLYWFAEKVNGGAVGLNGKLTADITVNTGDVSGCGGAKADGWRDWTPINEYSGVFDGCGKTISGLYLKNEVNSIGLFGKAMSGTVKDLTLANSYFRGGMNLGGICSSNYGTIQNCVNDVTVCGTDATVGGICGYNHGTIANCGNTGTVSGLYVVGGICGGNQGSVMNCYNTATVTGGDESIATAVGAICGTKEDGGTVTNSYYLAGCATDVIGTVQYGIGGGLPGKTTADVTGSTTSKTAAQFASGEVCWLLNGSASTGVWKQDLDVDDTPDASPNFTGAAVYYNSGLTPGYSNTEAEPQAGFTVSFYNENGTTFIQTKTGATLDAAVAAYDGAAQTKAATAQYTYHFDKWVTTAVDEAAGTYSAVPTFTSTVNKYDVKFFNYDGVQIGETQSVEYGSDATAPAAPTKPYDNNAHYTFDGWTGYTNITADTDITATFTAAPHSYTYEISTAPTADAEGLLTGTCTCGKTVTVNIPALNDTDYTVISTAATPDAAGNTHYVWNDNDTYGVNVTGDIAIPALGYTVSFYQEDGTTFIQTKTGATLDAAVAAYDGAAQTKAATAQYTYTFDKWVTTAVDEAAGTYSAVPTFTSTVNKYDVKFFNYDGVQIGDTQSVEYGSDATAPAAPTKPYDNNAHYTFDGWTGYTNITGNTDIMAAFTAVPHSYTYAVTKAPTADAEGLLTGTCTCDKTVTVNIPALNDTDYTVTTTAETPASAGNTRYVWDDNDTYGVNVTADIALPALGFTVSFYNEDGTTFIQTKTGATLDAAVAAYDGAAQTKAATAQYTYTFAGWTTTAADESSGSYKAVAKFDKAAHKYTVTFRNDDGTVLDTQSVAYGTAASAPTDPTKAKTAQYSYTFTGWDKTFDNITGDLTVTASYTSTLNTYTVSYYNNDGTVLYTAEVPYGSSATYQGEVPAYVGEDAADMEFAGWSVNTDSITGETTVRAVYKDTSSSLSRFFDILIAFIIKIRDLLIYMTEAHGEAFDVNIWTAGEW